MIGSSYVPEKSLSEGENAPKCCLIMLGNDISGKVVINDGSMMNYMNDVRQVPDEGHYIGKYLHDEEDEDEEEDGDDFSEEELLVQMGYNRKSEPEKLIKKEHQKQYDDDEDEEYDNILEESLLEQMGYLKKEPPKHDPDAAPTAALKLVSALKGSREKEGKQTRECRVSWAPDVYDPPPFTEPFSATSTRRLNEHKVKGLVGKNRQKMGGKGTGGLEDGGGGGGEGRGGAGGKGSKVGGSKGTVGGVGKAGVKYEDRKQVKKKHGGSASKYSNLDDC